MVTRVLIAALAATLAIGCEKRSTKYCGLHGNDLANCDQTDAPLPEPVACTTNMDCIDAYCELGANICVECLDNTHCDSDKRCDVGGSYKCRGCISDTDCPGGTCLAAGSCGDDTTVLYVKAGGDDDGTCGFAEPCASIERAVDLVSSTRNTIRVEGELTESPPLIDGKTFDLIGAPGAKVNGVDGTDWVFKLSASIVNVYGLEVFCTGGTDQVGFSLTASTVTLDGIELSGCGRGGGAIDIHMGRTVIDRSNIHDNINAGIKTDGGAKFSVTNSWIHHNLGSGGAINTDATMLMDVKIEFNTIVDNLVVGIKCKNAFATPNNIIASNGALLTNNVSGCDAAGSLVTDDLGPLAFTNSDAAPYDYHIAASSTAKDTTTIPSLLMNDIDGELRPQDAARDFGADEYKAP